MKPEDLLALSFYKEIEPLNGKKNISLVRHIETGEFFVKKTYKNFDSSIYEILSQKHFTGVPKILLTVKDDENLIVVEEYINGSNLQDIMEKRKSPFTKEETVSFISRICDILTQFHNNDPQLIHRDIKASNIILTPSGELFLTDFNISRKLDKSKSHDTKLMGTFGYAAPEQYGFKQCTSKTDIYALGVLTKLLLTGSIENIWEYTGPLAKVIKKATAIDPDNRYKDVIAMKAAINEPNKISPKRGLIYGLYCIFAISVSYTSAKDFTPSMTFEEALVCDILFLFSPLLYIEYLRRTGKKFSDVLWKHRLISCLLGAVFIMFVLFIISLAASIV